MEDRKETNKTLDNSKIIEKMHSLMGILDYHYRREIIDQFFEELTIEVIDIELERIEIDYKTKHITAAWDIKYLWKNKINTIKATNQIRS